MTRKIDPEDSKHYKTRRDRFERVAELRVNNVLISLRRLEQCGNSGNYAWQANEAVEIFDALQAALDRCREAYSVVEKPAAIEFKFKRKDDK